MAPKGISAEEKRKRILEILKQNGGEVYALKELENLGGKRGIVVQTIKDVVQSLVDDNLVDTDKIGSGNFYWAIFLSILIKLPSKEGQKKKLRLTSLESSVSSVSTSLNAEKSRAVKLLADRVSNSDRASKLEKLRRIKEQEASLKAQLQLMSDRDPVLLAQLQSQVEENAGKINMWTSATKSAISLVARDSGKGDDEIMSLFEVAETDLEDFEL